MSIEGTVDFFVFSALVLAITLYGLVVAVYFPKQMKTEKLEAPRDWTTRALIAVTILVVALSTVHGFGFALSRLSGPIAIIGAGLAMLVAPVVLKRFSDNVVDGRIGLIAFAGLTGIFAFLAQRLTG